MTTFKKEGKVTHVTINDTYCGYYSHNIYSKEQMEEHAMRTFRRKMKLPLYSKREETILKERVLYPLSWEQENTIRIRV